MPAFLVAITIAFAQSTLQPAPPGAPSQRAPAPTTTEQLFQRAVALASGSDAQATLDALQEALAAGADSARALTEPALLPLHENAGFRNLIRRFTTKSETTLVTPGEPGPPLRVQGRILDADGKPVAGARMYVFQTGATGSYSTAGGNAADSGDSLNPRIFGYMISAQDGSYAFSTIRPGPYPGDGPPAHIHYEVRVVGHEPAITEFMFEDDPRLTAEARGWVTRAGFGIGKPTRDATGVQHCTFDIKLTRKNS